MVKIIFESDNGIGQVFMDRDFDFPKSNFNVGLGKVRLPGAANSDSPI